MKALSLARRGKTRAAQSVLAADGRLPEDPVELHALAALVTSEGDYPRAVRLWRMLLDREPGHREAQRMIAAIELWLSRPPWVRYVPIGAAVLLVVILILAIAGSAGRTPRAGGPVPAPPPPPSSQSRSDGAHARAPSANPGAAATPTIKVPGVSKH
jgi:hypothetical protein